MQMENEIEAFENANIKETYQEDLLSFKQMKSIVAVTEHNN